MKELFEYYVANFQYLTLFEKVVNVFFWGIVTGFVMSMSVLIVLIFKDLWTLNKMEREQIRRYQ